MFAYGWANTVPPRPTALTASEAAAGEKSWFDARVIPSVAYTDPEVAWVGLTEDQAKAQGIKLPEAPKDAFEPIWCAWGYGRTMQPKQVLDTLPSGGDVWSIARLTPAATRPRRC